MPAKSKSPNLDAAKSGCTRVALEVLRDTLALQLDTATASIHAQLAAQYRATLADLAALDVPKTSGGLVDEITARREAKGRRATSDASANA